MTLQEYNYANKHQRKHITVNTLITFIIIGFLEANYIYFFNSIYLYNNYTSKIIIFSLLFMLAGNIFGVMVYSLIKNSRIVYIINEFMFISIIIALFFRNIIFKTNDYDLFFNHFLLAGKFNLILFTPFFICGSKLNYFLKISSGLFIDEKTGSAKFIFFLFLGTISGIITFYALYFFKFNHMFLSALPILLIIFLFTIKEKYNPDSFVAREISDTDKDDEKSVEYRDDIFFTYLNFTYLVIYLYLAALTMVKVYGFNNENYLYFTTTVIISILLGYILSIIVKNTFWYIYIEMLYPLFFVLYYISLTRFGSGISLSKSIIMIIPLCLAFGFTLYHSIKSILSRHNQKKSFHVINISIFILPVPILSLLNFTSFTYRIFFIILYIISILNIILPGLHLTQRKMKDLKKGIYFILILITVPLFIFSHLYFKLKPENKLLFKYSRNFEKVKNIDFDSAALIEDLEITISEKKILKITEIFYNSMQKATLSLSLFCKNENSQNLIIDGNSKFIFNKFYDIIPNAIILDYVPQKLTDNIKPGNRKYKSSSQVENNIYSFFKKNKQQYNSITMIPNLIDGKYNYIIFSKYYLSMLKSKLIENKIFSTIVIPDETNPVYLNSLFKFLKNNYKNTLIFNYGKIIVTISSDSRECLQIDDGIIQEADNLVQNADNIFYDGLNLFSHISLTDISKYNFQNIEPELNNNIFYNPESSTNSFAINSNEYIIEQQPSNKFLEIYKKEELSNITKIYSDNKDILNLLFQAEYANRKSKYSDELKHYLELKTMSRFNPKLKKYLDDIFSKKIKNYTILAKKCEKNKDWFKAQELYIAIIEINPLDFNAIYKLGIISITLQDFDTAFEYLNRAQLLDPDNTDVMYHLGVLLFANEKIKDAQKYLKKAISYNRADAMTYFYLGLTYEYMNDYYNFTQALKYYKIALEIEPNNDDIHAAFTKMEKTVEKIESSWYGGAQSDTEAEEDESVPIPIMQKAINARKRAEERAEQENE